MVQEHPEFIQPESVHSKVWRYMDFTKFISLMESRSLFFARADKLGDPFEGSFPRPNYEARLVVPDSIAPEAREGYAKGIRAWASVNDKWPRYVAVNCWHMNEHESAAMWRMYLKSDEGIAVQTTYAGLRDSIVDDEQVFVGTVRYLDYETEWFQSGNMFAPFMFKRKSFDYEREVRAIVSRVPSVEGRMDFTQQTIDGGVSIRVDLSKLIERVYVAPSCPSWLSDLVAALVKRYGFTFPVVRSRLDDRPLF